MNLIAKLFLNNLYVKFGMKSEGKSIAVLKTNRKSDMDKFDNILGESGESVQDLLTIGNHYIVEVNSNSVKYNEDDDLYHGLDVNVAIASTITSGARCFMSTFKNNNKFEIYYTDTDSIVTNKALPDKLVGNKLGQLKLEYKIADAVFLAPKVYGFKTSEGQEVIKVKGLTPKAASDIHLPDLKLLLVEGAGKKKYSNLSGLKICLKVKYRFLILVIAYKLQHQKENLYLFQLDHHLT